MSPEVKRHRRQLSCAAT